MSAELPPSASGRRAAATPVDAAGAGSAVLETGTGHGPGAPSSPSFDSVLAAGASSPAPRGRGKVLGIVVALALVVVLGIGAYAVFGGSDDAKTGAGATSASIERGSAAAADLSLEGSVGVIALTADAPEGKLVTVDTTGDDAAAQLAGDESPVATLGGQSSTVRLAPDVAWGLTFGAESDSVSADLLASRVSSVTIAAGARQVVLTLPAPDDVTPITLEAGVGALTVRTPAGVPVKVDVASGAGQVVIDGKAENGVPGGTELTTEGFSQDAPHYEVHVPQGVGTLTIQGDA